MIAWMHLIVSLLGGGILVGLGLTKARAVSSLSGWLFAGGGALIALSSCCVSAPFLVAEELPDPVIVFRLTTILGSSADLVATLIIAGAFVVLARARLAASTAP